MTPSAVDQLQYFRKFEQKTIIDAIKTQLAHEPLTKTTHRKPLRESPLSRWELCIRHYRVFYDVDQEHCLVEIKAIGYKDHNTLYFKGKEFSL